MYKGSRARFQLRESTLTNATGAQLYPASGHSLMATRHSEAFVRGGVVYELNTCMEEPFAYEATVSTSVNSGVFQYVRVPLPMSPVFASSTLLPKPPLQTQYLELHAFRPHLLCGN
jgi:hypothetical protein